MKILATKGLPAALALCLAAAPVGADPRAEDTIPPTDTKVVPPGGETLRMSEFYAGGESIQTGSFPGTIVCLRSDRKFVSAAGEECMSGRRIFALKLEEGDLTQPLLAGSEEVAHQLDEMLGEDVVVQGKFYPSTGMILAASLQPKQTD